MQFETFQQQSVADGRFAPRVEDLHEILDDDKPSHDEKDFSFDYWSHCSWAARKIAERRPQTHIDFGSYLYFAGIASAFVDNFIYADIRQMPSAFPNLRWQKEDLRSISIASDSANSVSSLHVLEHIGLGRYGDTLDASGDLKAARELTRILSPGGQLLMVLPMDEEPCVRFNGERFYSRNQVMEMFGGLQLMDMATIWGGALRTDVPSHLGYTGCMVFTKEQAISA